MRIWLAIVLQLLLAGSIFGQKQTYNWYFGLNAGLDFHSNPPTLLFDGQINSNEGVASISDSAGNLLFYTDGMTVWDNTHHVMPNGTGLAGQQTSSQGALIVPKIGDSQRFYLFTIDVPNTTRGLSYSIINLALNNGKGDVETKNIFLHQPVCEKMTAIRHCNGRDFWIVTHEWRSDAYLS